jgi:hypothetical protein
VKVHFVSWDFRSPPGSDLIVSAIRSFTGGPIYAISVDVGTDDYIIALTDQPISSAQARRYWEQDPETATAD